MRPRISSLLMHPEQPYTAPHTGGTTTNQLENRMYVKTLNLWEETANGRTLHDCLMDGTIVLRCGQWVRTFPGNRPSRWVGTKTTGTMWASHWQGYNKKFRREQFLDMARRRRQFPEDFFTTPQIND